jgi:hypothetical protein
MGRAMGEGWLHNLFEEKRKAGDLFVWGLRGEMIIRKAFLVSANKHRPRCSSSMRRRQHASNR